jgi:hypothetical protein
MTDGKERNRYIFTLDRGEESEVKTIRAGINWLLQEIEDDESNIGFIGVDAKKYIRDSVGKALKGIGGALRENHTVEIDGNKVTLFTEHENYSTSYESGPAVVIRPSDNLLSDMESDNQVEDILVLSWQSGTYDDCEEWREKYSPTHAELTK